MPEGKFPTPELNLLSGDELENTTSGKFLKWALTWGRRIVVLTELVVISAFLSRFWLDTTVADLNEKIVRQKSVVESMAATEKKFRALTARIDKAQKIETATSVLTVYDEARELIPAEVVLTQLTVDPRGVAFAGSSDESVLKTIVTDFRASKNFSNINVERVAKTDADRVVEFSLKASYGH